MPVFSIWQGTATETSNQNYQRKFPRVRPGTRPLLRTNQNNMKIKLRELAFAAVCASVIAGCDSGGALQQINTQATDARPESTQVDVFDTFIALDQSEPLLNAAAAMTAVASYEFESIDALWTACEPGAVSLSNDANAGAAAMSIGAGTCAHETVKIIPGMSYTLSCFAELASPSSWTGMGMTYSNDTSESVSKAPTTVITSTSHTKATTTAVAPDDATYLSFWIYSDPGGTVDSCALSVVEDAPAAELPAPGTSLLVNSDFSATDANNYVEGWVLGCGGKQVADGNSLTLSDGACLDQAFSASDIDAINDAQLATFSCFVADVNGYADINVFLGENELAGEKQITRADKNSRVNLTINTVETTGAFVSLYSNGDLTVEDCRFTLDVGNTTDPTDATLNIVETAVANGSFNTLVAALQAAGLDAVLADETREFTVFAPTDDAFALLGDDTIQALLDDTDTLSNILLYHVLADINVDSATAISLAGTSVTAANGDELQLSLRDNELFINDSRVIIADVATSNGTIHVIDAVLLPPQKAETAEPTDNIVETAINNGNFKLLQAALRVTGLDSVLADESKVFTVFAPTDDAFKALGKQTLISVFSDRDTLRDILLYHVLSDIDVDSETAISLADSSVTATNGGQLNISLRGDALFINDSQVIIPDVVATNGRIHVIDAVLIP